MTIKQQGGIFGRNPTFNDVDVEGTLTTDTFTAASVTTESISTVNTDATSYASSSGSSIQPSGGVSSEIRNDSNGGFSWLKLRTTNSAAAIGYISYYNQGGGVVAGNMAFGGRTGSSSYNERMSLDMADGDLTLNSGNLVIGTSGKGIDFSATSDAPGSTSELFDDYEEGTWTPAFSGNTGVSGMSYSLQEGSYTKVGNLVTANLRIIVSGLGTLTGTFVTITGLPFAATGAGQATVGYFVNVNGHKPTVGGYVASGQSVITMSATNSGNDDMIVANFPIASVTATTQLNMSVTYQAA